MRPIDADAPRGEVARLLHPGGWPRPHGYAQGTAARGTLVCIAGQIGWDPRTEQFARSDIPGQVEQALRNVLSVLAEAGGTTRDVTRLNFYVIDAAAYRAARVEIGVAYRSVMGTHYPAMTLVQVAALMPAGAQVEIEAIAVVP